jgi:CHAT domain-containing protein/tetratricopeptide (TPR) repeat protein
MKTHSFIRRIILFSFSAGICPFPAAGGRDMSPAPRVAISVSTNGPAFEIRIDEMRRSVEANPDAWPLYHSLLESWLMEGAEFEALDYFDRLSSEKPYGRNCLWMLAKLYAMRNDDSSAFNCYKRSISAADPCPELLEDFIVFDRAHAGKFKAHDVLLSLLPPGGLQTAVRAVSAYYDENYARAGRMLEKIGRKGMDEKWLFRFLGDCYNGEHRPADASSIYRQGLARARREASDRYQAVFLLSLGILENAEGWQDHALALFDSAEIIAGTARDFKILQIIYSNRASVYSIQGRYRECIRLNEAAISIAGRLHDDLNLAEWSFNNAQAFYSTGNFYESLRAFNRSEDLYRRFGMRQKLVELDFRRACLYMILDQIDLSRTLLERALLSAGQQGFSMLQNEISTQLAVLLTGQNEYSAARGIFRKNIQYFDSSKKYLWGSYALSALAGLARKEGNAAEAAGLLDKAFEYANRAGSKTQAFWYALTAADLKLERNRPDEAIEMYLRVIPVAVAVDDSSLLSNAFAGLGKAFRRKGDIPEAIRYNRLAMDIVEQIRRSLEMESLQMGYFSTMFGVTREMAACYFHEYRRTRNPALLDTLLHCMEMSRARSLQEYPTADRSSSTDTSAARLIENLRVIQRRLRFHAGPAAERDSLLRQLQVVRYSIMNRRMQIDENRPLLRPRDSAMPSLVEAMRRLKKINAGLLYFMIEDNGSFALVLTGAGAKAVPLEARTSELQSAVDSLIAPLHRPENAPPVPPIFRADLAHRLYLRLFQPLESAAALPENVIIIPDAAVTNLPFELLLTRAADKKLYTPGDPADYASSFLLLRHCLSYAPSVGSIMRKSGISGNKPEIAVFSNPFDDRVVVPEDGAVRSSAGWSFRPLPYSDVEAREIGRYCGRTRIFRRSQATKEAFFSASAGKRILHFATHAFVDPLFDDYSGLVLAAGPDSSDDGLLMGYELRALQLRSDLITLSACETGCGRLLGGEGVLGLPRLLLKSGACSVLMTLWKVDDRFASMLMPRFYNNFVNRSMSKAEALCEAKRAVLSRSTEEGAEASYAHPFYWASFVLYGDPGSVQKSYSAWKVSAAVAFVAMGLLFGAWTFYRMKRQQMDGRRSRRQK